MATIKKALAVVLSVCMMLSFSLIGSAADGATEIKFNLGADGAATHADGSSTTTYSETVDGYTLSITNGVQLYKGVRDAKGNGGIRIGSSKNVGSFKFTVPDDIASVIIAVAQYKANASTVIINGTSYSIKTASNNGEYTEIEVDTSVNKNVTVATSSSQKRAVINYITYIIPAAGGEECEHDYDSEVTTAPTCTESGTITNTCVLCGKSYTEVAPATGHTWNEGEVIAPTVEADGYTIYTCTVCGATENRDYVEALLPEGTTEIKFELGTDVAAGTHKDGSTSKTTYTETVGDYTLSIENGVNMYPGSNDLTGEMGIKIGKGDATGSFSFTVPAEVTSVVIRVAQYKNNATTVNINGEDYKITTLSNDGIYTPIEVDTKSTKTVEVKTVGTTYRAMIAYIAYRIVESACEHDYDSEVTTAPTCTEDGVITNTCVLCGDSFTEAVDALGHDFVAGNVIPSNGTEVGYTEYACSRCEETKKDDFTATAPEGLEEIVFDFGENGTKADDGKEIKEAELPYEFVSGDYTLTITAASKVYHTAFDANFNSTLKLGTSSATASFTMSVPENVDYVVINIAGYKKNVTVFTINDGEAQTVELGSDNGAYMPVIIDTTETKTITLSTTSAGCRAMIDSIVYWASTEPACAHEYDNDCDADCNLCGEVRETSHKYESNVTAPTCTAKGYTTHTCSVCGDSYTDSETDMIAHDYKSEVTAPTCTAKGYTTHTCTVCNDSYTDSETDMIAHSYGEGVVTAPTATEQGYTTYTCTVCQYSYKDNFTPATGEPEVLYNLQLTETDEYIKVTWDAVEDATKYNLIVKNEENVTLYTRALEADATSAYLTWRNGDVEWDKTYKITLQPRTSKWLTASSLFGSLEVGDRIVDIKTESVGRTIKVTWRAYEGATEYRAYVYDKEGTYVTNVKVTTNSAIIVNAINPEVDYIVKVIATKGTPSMPAANALAIPARLNVFTPNGFWSRGLAPNRAAVSWDEVRGTFKYWAYLTPVNGGETLTRESKKAIANFTGLTPNTEYQVRMRLSIIDADGNTHYSETATLGTFTTPGWEDISFTSVATEAGAELSWNAHTNASSYIIYRATNGTSFKKLATISDPTQLSYVDATAKNGYAYAIIIKVKDDQVSTSSPMIKLAPIVK